MFAFNKLDYKLKVDRFTNLSSTLKLSTAIRELLAMTTIHIHSVPI